MRHRAKQLDRLVMTLIRVPIKSWSALRGENER